MTYEEAYNILECLAIDMTGAIATKENEKISKDIEAINIAQGLLKGAGNTKDLVEVIRCKDCINYRTTDTGCRCDLVVNLDDAPITPNCFCARAERKFKPKGYREVYENVKDDCADCCIEVDCAIADCDNYLILKALDNMIKKKPEDIRKWENDRLVCAKCPSCTSFINNDMRYCDFCGQAIDWSEE